MPIDVLDVGDGACSTIECHYPGCNDITVVDCGEWRTTGAKAAEKLATHVRPDQVRRFVVTHFDADHWFGIRQYAKEAGSLGAVELIYPRIPVEPIAYGAAVMALISTASDSSGVRATDLAKTLKPVCSSLDVRAVSRGDRFEAGCDHFDVLWPPKASDSSSFSLAIRNAVESVHQLAEELDKTGFPALRKNLDEAYELRSFSPRHEHEDVGRQTLEPDTAELEALIGDRADQHADGDAPGERDSGGHSLAYLQESEKFPEERLPEIRSVSRKVARINNLLSLVAHNASNTFLPKTLFCGDVEGASLRHLLAAPGGPSEFAVDHSYDLVFAPHHGSHPLPNNFPDARACVAQCGARHEVGWRKHHGRHNAACLAANSTDAFLRFY